MADMADNLVTLIDEKWSGPAKPDIIEKVLERPDWGKFGKIDRVIIMPLGSGRHIHVTRDYYNVVYGFEIVCYTMTSSDRLKELYEEVIDILYNWYLTGVDKQRVMDQQDLSDKTYRKFKYTIHIEIEAIMVYKGTPVTSGIPSAAPFVPSECSYLIYIEDSIINAKNGETGKVDYSGADAATVIQAVLNASPHGLIFFKKGTYVLSQGLTVNAAGSHDVGHGLRIECEGTMSGYEGAFELEQHLKENGVWFQPSNSFSSGEAILTINKLVDDYHWYGVSIKNLNVECKNPGGTAVADGIYIYNVYHPVFEDVLIDYPLHWGFYLRSGVSAGFDQLEVNRCTVSGVQDDSGGGFRIENAFSGGIYHGTVISSKGNAFEIYSGAHLELINCMDFGPYSQRSFFLSGCLDATLLDCKNWIPNGAAITAKNSIYLASSRAKIIGGEFGGADKNDAYGGWQSAVIFVQAGDCIITNVRIKKSQYSDYSIYDWGTAATNLYINNLFSGFSGNHIYLATPANCVVRDNVGYATENIGTATITSGNTSISPNHGLVAAPTRVLITPTTDTGGKRFWVSAKAASTFTITIDSSYGSDIVFDWRAWI